MDRICDQFTTGRRLMLDAFADLTVLARRVGVNPDAITETHGRFFDGNVAVKHVFRVCVLLAELGRSRPRVSRRAAPRRPPRS